MEEKNFKPSISGFLDSVLILLALMVGRKINQTL